ncbi:MAG: DUF192 domain-containing protein [bacterium]|nr:DUF192 domain-containing protein [bacterium]
MLRNFYIGLLAIVVIGSVIFFYRTESQSEQVAEFGGVSLRIEYATTTLALEKGLSGRDSVPSDYGMLFVFQKDDKYGFWMKDTLVPLDIFWLNSKGHVVYIVQDIATSTYPNVFYPTEPARYVLETVAGFAREHDIKIGSKLMLKNLESVSQ